MRKLATFGASFGVAIILSQYLLKGVLQLILCGIVFAAGAVCFIIKSDVCTRLVIICIGIACGFGWNYLYSQIWYAPAAALDGETKVITAVVSDYPVQAAYGEKVQVKLTDEHNAKALFYYYSDEDLKPGDVVRAEVRLKLSSETEENSYYTSKGIYLIAYESDETTISPCENVPLKYLHKVILKEIKTAIADVFSEDTKGFMLALLTGDKSELPEEFSAELSRTGLSHVVATSGMHVSFLVMAVGLFIRNRRVRALVSIPVVLVFMIVLGSTPSIVRAGIMTIMVNLAPILWRESDSITSLMLALLILLLANPFSIKNIGMQLSFASMLGLILFSNPIYNWILARTVKKKTKKRYKVLISSAAGSVAASLSAIIFTVPLTAYYFGTVSLIAPIANLLCLWMISILFAAGMLIVLLSMVIEVLGVAAAVLYPLVRLFMFTVSLLSKIPFAAILTDDLYFRFWLYFAYGLLLLFIFYPVKKKRIVIPACCLIISLGVSILLSQIKLLEAGLTLTVLDVGQGESVVALEENYTAVIDCGGNAYGSEGNITADYIQNAGRSKIDLLILTHYHEDHAGGAVTLLKRLDVKMLIVPEIEEDDDSLKNEILSCAEIMDTRILEVSEDVSIDLGNCDLEIYAPMGTGENEEGLIVLISSDDDDALITGDAGVSVEAKLLKKKELPDIEVLVVGHHGSKNSTSKKLLDQLLPEIAVISVGKNNYGHPADETLERLYSRDINVYRTDLQGTIEIKMDLRR